MPPPTERTPFGQHVRMLRLKRGWTQREVAARAGITAAQVSIAETVPNDKLWTPLIAKLADVYEADPDELFALAGRITPDLLDAMRGDLATMKRARRAIFAC